MNLLQFSVPLLFLSLIIKFILDPLSYGANILTSHDNGNILLLTAHPDDECMFFAPTIQSLVQQRQAEERLAQSQGKRVQGGELYSLCLSVGNAEGLGDIRRRELEGSLDVLGVARGKRWVLDHPQLQDNMTQQWDSVLVAEVIKPYLLKHNITTILTFDEYGISGHANHYSLPKGVLHLISTSLSSPSYLNNRPPPRLFTLISVPVYRKFLGLHSLIYNKLRIYATSYLQGPQRQHTSVIPMTFIAGLFEYVTALEAMLQHQSQLVWFRWLYVTFSRYMWVNEWVEVVPPAMQNSSGVDYEAEGKEGWSRLLLF
ncbi:LmbE-like protein [Panus rudis PR-1116 ss-1]|nr:LmbE-like protein [Panus rudis PR-1116 ss-1]